jgi:hypothetical protein
MKMFSSSMLSCCYYIKIKIIRSIAYFLAAKLLIGFGIDCGLVKAIGVFEIA